MTASQSDGLLSASVANPQHIGSRSFAVLSTVAVAVSSAPRTLPSQEWRSASRRSTTGEYRADQLAERVRDNLRAALRGEPPRV